MAPEKLRTDLAIEQKPYADPLTLLLFQVRQQ